MSELIDRLQRALDATYRIERELPAGDESGLPGDRGAPRSAGGGESLAAGDGGDRPAKP